MKKLAKIIILIVGLSVFSLVAVTQGIIKSKIRGGDFKSFAELKVGGFLKANVHIKDIRLKFLNRVSFRGLEIETPVQKGPSYRVQIREIVFHYDPIQVLTQNIRSPSTVELKSPQVAIPGKLFPYDMIDRINFGREKDMISGMEIVDGSISYGIPSLNTRVDLTKVNGSVKPSRDGKVRLEFKAHVAGFLEGEVSVQGDVDVVQRTHQLKLELHGVSFGKMIPLPLDKIDGQVVWNDDNFFFDKLNAVVHGWKVHLQGAIEHLSKEPSLELDWQIGKGEPSIRGAMRMDLGSHVLKGQTKAFGKPSIFYEGKARREGLRLVFDELDVNQFYRGRGWLDFKSGNYRFDFQNKKQQITVDSNLKGLDFDLNVKFDHLAFNGLDLVTSARIQLSAPAEGIRSRSWRLKGIYQTDYFICEYIPFDDFRGSFEVTPYGIKNLEGSWGRAFDLRGMISFRNKYPDASMIVRVAGFDLSNVQNFASKPLPRKLGGIMDGRIKIDGDLRHPEVLGNFTIKDGTLGRLEYDHGVLQFRGVPPYLALNDSRVMKGRTTFLLEGALDLSLRNIFHGMQITSPDKFVIWRGWEINTSKDEGDLEFDRFNMPTLSLKAGSENAEGVDGENNQKDEKQYFVVGSKFKF